MSTVDRAAKRKESHAGQPGTGPPLADLKTCGPEGLKPNLNVFFLLFFVLNLLQPLRITVRKSNLSQGHCYRFLCLACVVGYRFRGSILMFYDVMLDRKSDELRSFREFLPIKAHSNSSIRLHSFYQFTEIECAYNLKMKINKQDSQLNYVLRSHFFFLIVKSEHRQEVPADQKNFSNKSSEYCLNFAKLCCQ